MGSKRRPTAPSSAAGRRAWAAAGGGGWGVEEVGADLGIGIEDGIEETPHGTFLGGWAAVVDRSGRVGLGGGMRIALPPEVAELARHRPDLPEVLRERSALEEVE